jgi:NADH-quinone oxidoreductase subunit E
MLTEEERNKMEHEIKNFPKRSAACIEALKIVQKNRRWVSDESIKDIAAFLNMTADEVDAVATFYNLIFRKPVGKNVILLCDSVSCWIMGYENILGHLNKELKIKYGETTADERFTLLPVNCLGKCDCAPALMIGEDLHENILAENIKEILEKYK